MLYSVTEDVRLVAWRTGRNFGEWHVCQPRSQKGHTYCRLAVPRKSDVAEKSETMLVYHVGGGICKNCRRAFRLEHVKVEGWPPSWDDLMVEDLELQETDVDDKLEKARVSVPDEGPIEHLRNGIQTIVNLLELLDPLSRNYSSMRSSVRIGQILEGARERFERSLQDLVTFRDGLIARHGDLSARASLDDGRNKPYVDAVLEGAVRELETTLVALLGKRPPPPLTEAERAIQMFAPEGMRPGQPTIAAYGPGVPEDHECGPACQFCNPPGGPPHDPLAAEEDSLAADRSAEAEPEELVDPLEMEEEADDD